ncbi:restriction endonuclease [Flavobacterium sp. W22_SRS_FP1]|uniref:restriction endonuclease n=1 Tax=Flavobacterium sp. W22_SRS_FP1 TaxID=3240276 RepID=UPI003F9213B7
MKIKIVKNSGDVVDFDPEKLKKSLLKSGASQIVVEDILHKIGNEIYQGISTKQIYKRAFSLLKKEANSHAARYNLREGLRLLGPAGFFFEKYIARLFTAEGYITVTNLILQGKCVSHEIDVIAKSKDVIVMIECKFHSRREASSDVKIPLYVFSRFNDLKEKQHVIFSLKDTMSKCWIATNNRFTSDAIDFAKCSGLNLLSWDYPKNNSLKTKNDIDCLYPVTCLTTLSIAEKDKLLVLDIILAKELISNPDKLERIGLSSSRIKNVLKEARELSKCI